MVIASVTHKPNEFNSTQTNRENGKTNRPKLGSNQSKFEARFGLRICQPLSNPRADWANPGPDNPCDVRRV